MPKYGIINADGSMSTSSKELEGYKPIRYERIPDGFNQETHYVEQSNPTDEDDHIYVGIEVHELELEDDDFDEDIL